MRAPNPGGSETVIGLITRIFKQTAIAKVLLARPSCICLHRNSLICFNVYSTIFVIINITRKNTNIDPFQNTCILWWSRIYDVCVFIFVT